MLKFKEYPRGGSANSPIENKGELHLPCVVLVDTSSSMASVKSALHDGLTEMGKAIREDPLALGRVEFCIISFDDTARIAVPFGPAYDFEAPRFDCDGMTAMHAAVDMGLEEVEARIKQYKDEDEKTPYYRPWIFMLTDGGANDEDNGAFERLRQSQQNKKCIFYPIAIGNEADKALLKSLNITGEVLTASKEDFVRSFVWLSRSLIGVSDSIPGQKVKLPKPGDYQMEVEV